MRATLTDRQIKIASWHVRWWSRVPLGSCRMIAYQNASVWHHKRVCFVVAHAGFGHGPLGVCKAPIRLRGTLRTHRAGVRRAARVLRWAGRSTPSTGSHPRAVVPGYAEKGPWPARHAHCPWSFGPSLTQPVPTGPCLHAAVSHTACRGHSRMLSQYP